MLPLLKQYVYDFAPGEVPPSIFTIHETVKKFETTGSMANKKRNRKGTVLTEETLDEIGASVERTPTECCAHRATKLLKLKPYKCTSVHCLKQTSSIR